MVDTFSFNFSASFKIPYFRRSVPGALWLALSLKGLVYLRYYLLL